MAKFKHFSTYSFDELVLTDGTRFVIVKLFKKPIPPVPVFVEEQKEVFDCEGMWDISGSKVEVDHFEEVVLSGMDYFMKHFTKSLEFSKLFWLKEVGLLTRDTVSHIFAI